MTVDRDIFDLRMKGTYLPGLILLAIHPNLPLLYFISFFSLLCAVYFHGLSRKVFGIGGAELNPLPREQVLRNIQVAITGKGPHKKFPGTIGGMGILFLTNPRLLGFSGLIFVLIGCVSFFVWIVGVATTIYFGTIQMRELSTGVQILVFAEYVWILQWLVWPRYSPSHLLDQKDFE